MYIRHMIRIMRTLLLHQIFYNFVRYYYLYQPLFPVEQSSCGLSFYIFSHFAAAQNADFFII